MVGAIRDYKIFLVNHNLPTISALIEAARNISTTGPLHRSRDNHRYPRSSRVAAVTSAGGSRSQGEATSSRKRKSYEDRNPCPCSVENVKALVKEWVADEPPDTLLGTVPFGEHEPAEVSLPGAVHVSAAAVEAYWDLKFDGASGAGKGGAGITLTSEGEKFHLSYKLDFECSNNEAEYEALILGLIAAEKKGLRKLKILGDSELVVRQRMGDFALKEPLLGPYRTVVQGLLPQFDDVQI
ncbi:uncharacterized protein LOC114301451 [Camellia sinensis]|uniref:uncharacterized protein LOC114301451 n=1 Tax=Camellia sinensis TaxID=4442 RepID=UPI001036ACBF|nr:uncharacterized protein LOC114301451 [Camellia sinensis]